MKVFERFYYGWVIVGAAILIGFLTTGLSGYSNGILLPKLAEDIADGSRGQISIAFSLASLMAAFVAPFIGRMADERSPRILIFLGAIMIALAYVITGFATEVWHVWFAKGFCYGLGVTLAGPIVRNLIVAHWFDRWRGRALGFAVLGASIAGVILPIVLNELINELGWRYSLFLFGLTVFVVLLPTALFVLRDRPADIGEVKDGRKNVAKFEDLKSYTPTDDGPAFTWLQMLGKPAFWACGLIFGPMTAVYIVIMIHLFGHAVESGLTEAGAAIILSTMAAFSLIGKPLIGTLADYVGARLTIWASLLLQASALFVFTLSSEMWHFVIGAVLQGIGYSALSSMKTYALSVTLGMRSLGSSVGLLKWIELPFVLCASPAAGFVFDYTGRYDAAFLVFAGLLLVACIGPIFIRDRLPQPAN